MRIQILNYIKQTKKIFLTIILLGITNKLLGFLYIPFIRIVEEKLFYTSSDINKKFFLYIILFVACTTIFHYVSKKQSSKYYIKMNENLKNNFVESLWKLEPQKVYSIGLSKYGILGVKVETCSFLIDNLIEGLCSAIMLLFLCIYICLVMDIRYFFFVVLMICIPFGTMILSKPIMQKQEKLNERQQQILLLIQNMMKGLGLIKCYSLENIILKNFRTNIAHMSKLEQEKKNCKIIMDVYQQLAQCTIMIIIPVLAALMSSKIDLVNGGILSSTYIFFYLLNNMLEIAERIGKIQEQKEDLNFLEQYYNIPQLSIEDRSTQYELNELTVENLCYSYDEKPVLNFSSLKLPVTGLVLIKGKSGVGKSTLLKCISGFYFADKGKYSLGNQKITRDVLLRLCVYEPQEPVLSGNIMENFKMANESLNDSKIFNIIKNNDIDLLEKVKDKTSVEKLSGGEKKLIQILRGISSGANWVLLDEPFNALDIDIKEKMVKIIAEASKDRCIVATMHENYLDAYACYTYNLQ